MKKIPQHSGPVGNVTEAVAIQHPQERLHGFAEDAREPASRGDQTLSAGNEVAVALGMAHDRADSDLGCRTSQSQPAIPSPDSLDETRPPKTLDNLHQVILRNAICLRDPTDRDQFALKDRKMDHDPESIIGMARQFHAASIDAFVMLV